MGRDATLSAHGWGQGPGDCNDVEAALDAAAARVRTLRGQLDAAVARAQRLEAEPGTGGGRVSLQAYERIRDERDKAQAKLDEYDGHLVPWKSFDRVRRERDAAQARAGERRPDPKHFVGKDVYDRRDEAIEEAVDVLRGLLDMRPIGAVRDELVEAVRLLTGEEADDG